VDFEMFISVGIPAYNEEKNIGELLESLLRREDQLLEIIVVSEGSSDATEKVAQSYAKRNSKVKVYGGKVRKGKAYAINKIFNISRGDLIVLLDADVQIRSNFIHHIKQFFTRGQFDLISCIPYPAEPSRFNPVQRAMVFAANLRLHFLNSNPYYAFLRLIAIKGEIAKKIRIPEQIIGDDAYLYFLGIKSRWKIGACRDVKVIYKEPSTLHDAASQWVRYKKGLQQLTNLFREFVWREVSVPKKKIIKAIMSEATRRPFDLLIWLIVRILVRLYSYFTLSEADVFWETAISTK